MHPLCKTGCHGQVEKHPRAKIQNKSPIRNRKTQQSRRDLSKVYSGSQSPNTSARFCWRENSQTPKLLVKPREKQQSQHPSDAQDMWHRGEGKVVLAISQFSHNLSVSLNNTARRRPRSSRKWSIPAPSLFVAADTPAMDRGCFAPVQSKKGEMIFGVQPTNSAKEGKLAHVRYMDSNGANHFAPRQRRPLLVFASSLSCGWSTGQQPPVA